MQIKSEIKKGEKSTIDIIAEIQEADLLPYRERAIAQLGANVEIKGFRKGKVPADVIEKEFGDMRILDEMAHMAISESYPQLLEEHKLDAIGRPSVSVTKLAVGNPLGFTITTAVVPEIKLPDYAKIASSVMKGKDDATISDGELDEAMLHIRKMRFQDEAMKEGKDPKETAKTEDKDIPELTDDYVKTLGKFENVDDFKNKLKENLTLEKEQKAKEKKQMEVAEQILEKTDMEIPTMLVDYEVQKMMAQLENDIAMSGMKFDDYLKHIKKTKEELRKEWNEPASKRAKMNLIIDTIAKAEKLAPSDEEITTETAKIMEQYKDMKDVEEANVQAYVASILTNQKVFDFFEKQ